MFADLKNRFSKFHNDQDGMESLQVVMIIAIAAMVMTAVFTVGDDICWWMQENIYNMIHTSTEAF